MRSSDPRRRLARAATATALGWLLAVAIPALVLAAGPTATPGGEAGDPRSSGQGPGLVGNPGWALAIVVVIGVTAVLVTLAYVRMTAHRTPPDQR